MKEVSGAANLSITAPSIEMIPKCSIKIQKVQNYQSLLRSFKEKGVPVKLRKAVLIGEKIFVDQIQNQMIIL
jgi:hypothetical protein